MITIIFGAPGAGKTSLLTYFLKHVYLAHGRVLLKNTKTTIEYLNQTRTTPLTVPDKPPIFANFNSRFLVGYKKYFEPYFINPYYFGLPNDKMATQFVPPRSNIFISEAQTYYDSRKSANFPPHVARAYEKHRHYHLSFWLDVQRPEAIDLSIRRLDCRYIEVLGTENDMDRFGRIIKTVFRCREFENWTAVEQYINTGAGDYTETTYINEGNIFKNFNSYEYFNEFLPRDGQDFKLLTFNPHAAVRSDEKFYREAEPEEYRGKIAQTKKINKGQQI